MNTFVPQKQHLREVLLFCFNLKKQLPKAIVYLWKLMVNMLYLNHHAENGFETLKVET